MEQSNALAMDAAGPWDFRFSNFAPAIVRDEYGIRYPTIEHAYQASKTLNPAQRQVVAMLSKAGEAKRQGRRLTIRPDWETVKLGVMLGFLRQKFAPGSEYAANLVQTGDAVLCETNHWHDQYWGDCICPMHAATPGENWLGRLLIVRRAELLLESAVPS